MRVWQLRMELRSVLPRRVPGNVTINFWACLAYIARKGFTSELCSEAANHSTHCNAVKLLKCFEDNHWWSFWHDFVISEYCGFFSYFILLLVLKIFFGFMYVIVPSRSLRAFGPLLAECRRWSLLAKGEGPSCVQSVRAHWRGWECNTATHRAARQLWYSLPDFYPRVGDSQIFFLKTCSHA